MPPRGAARSASARKRRSCIISRSSCPTATRSAHGYDVLACDGCGFVYADTRVTQADYDAYYAKLSKYEDPRTGTGGGEQSWDDARLGATAETIATYLPDRSAKVVDVGCANGGLLRHLARLGFGRLCGVDPSPRCAASTAAVAGTTGLVGSLFALPDGAGQADAVVLSHVLEHVQELRRGVAAARRLLRPGGILYAEVPDATRYAECLAAPFQDFNTEHVNHFGPVSLAGLLAREGFEVLAVRRKTIEAAAGIPYPAVYAVARVRPSRTESTTPAADRELRPTVMEYARRSAALMRALDEELAPLAERGTPILLWGVGTTHLQAARDDPAVRGPDPCLLRQQPGVSRHDASRRAHPGARGAARGIPNRF